MINHIKGILIRFGIFKWLFQCRSNYPEISERMEDEWHLHTFSLREWLDLFEKSFKVPRVVKKIPFAWLALRYVIALKKKDE